MYALFHKDVFMPQEVKDAILGYSIKIFPSRHALAKMPKVFAQFGIDVPYEEVNKTITVNENNLIEAGFKDGELRHLLIREPYPYDERYDIVYAIATDNGTLKTFWLNRKDDRHKTLNTSKYIKENEWNEVQNWFEKEEVMANKKRAVEEGKYLLLDKIFDRKLKRWIFRVEDSSGRIWSLDDPIIISKLWDYKIGDYIPEEVMGDIVLYATVLAADMLNIIQIMSSKPEFNFKNAKMLGANLKEIVGVDCEDCVIYYDEDGSREHGKGEFKEYPAYFVFKENIYLPGTLVYDEKIGYKFIFDASLPVHILDKQIAREFVEEFKDTFEPLLKIIVFAIADYLGIDTSELMKEAAVYEDVPAEVGELLDEALEQNKDWIVSANLIEDGIEFIIKPNLLPNEIRQKIKDIIGDDIYSVILDIDDAIDLIREITGLDYDEIADELTSKDFIAFREYRSKTKASYKRTYNWRSFQKNPSKWRKFWESLTGDVEHKMYQCMRKVKSWTDNPEAFCAALKDFIEGTTYWRGRE